MWKQRLTYFFVGSLKSGILSRRAHWHHNKKVTMCKGWATLKPGQLVQWELQRIIYQVQVMVLYFLLIPSVKRIMLKQKKGPLTNRPEGEGGEGEAWEAPHGNRSWQATERGHLRTTEVAPHLSPLQAALQIIRSVTRANADSLANPLPQRITRSGRAWNALNFVGWNLCNCQWPVW